MEQNKIATALSLLRKLPPSKIHYNTNALSNLMPDEADELLQKVDKPLEIGVCSQTNLQYIKSEFNRDGDSFRSPHSNQYDPPIDDAVYPSNDVRQLEEKANTLFQEYMKLYYQGGICNIYFWDKENGGFACAFLMKKEVELAKGIKKGTWDSINVVDVKVDEQNKKKITYKCTGSVVLEMILNDDGAGDVNISGSLTKSKEDVRLYDGNIDINSFHLENIGRIVEDLESVLRTHLDTIYVGKTKENIFTTRSQEGYIQMEQTKKNLAINIIDRANNQKN
ncbi:hypothetical protein IMG5_148740 [Ichthyophthirius multifiliis]|uniref:F-actin-capping protein subunit beta n=1 Tax=Ichthyophthirius multifiliis TaxID=5932 RepID=G0QYC9_ICHMU|nr:hypothetical protein IMG5_148740 [Ichthyophthirius multifiliis]EGR29792.1 hypothetical protein IMG5_148740 [Ichthyophthirius multifiliis]|eukprot:XP_004031028.1 hypothetical protein IMG5_148740 [Ichthyophthirius multifiliis]